MNMQKPTDVIITQVWKLLFTHFPKKIYVYIFAETKNIYVTFFESMLVVKSA